MSYPNTNPLSGAKFLEWVQKTCPMRDYADEILIANMVIDGCSERSINLFKIFNLEMKLKQAEQTKKYTKLDTENDELQRYLNKYCLGKTVISYCHCCERNIGNMYMLDEEQTYETLSSYPVCHKCSYMEIDEWEKEYNVDIKKLKREHDARSVTPAYAEEDPSPILPEEND
tara:strand:+ start:4310 stop:4825 length:516 start_codon:yes stop_codon:yes gene_type:complete